MLGIDPENLKRRFRRGYRRFAKKKSVPLLATNFFQLLAVWGIAVVQPLLGVLGENTETFLKFRITGQSVLLSVLVLAFIPPVIGMIIESAFIRLRRAMFAIHFSAIGLLGVVAGLQIAKFYLHLQGGVQALLAIAVAGLLVALVVATKPGGEWLRMLAIIPVIAVAMFVFNTPAGRYARGAKVEAFDVKTGQTPIVYVMFDEFPITAILNKDGTIDADRFPNFARLASTSTWYRNYTTTSETTDLAVPSAMSGRLPESKQSFTYVDHPENLFTWLGGSYRMNVSEFLSEMCPPTVCNESNALEAAQVKDEPAQWRNFVKEMREVFGQRIDLSKKNEYDAVNAVAAQTDTAPVVTAPPTTATTTTTIAPDQTTTTAAQDTPHNIPFLAQIQPGRWREWVDAIPVDPTGTLNFIHVLLPHQSWVFYPDGSPYQLVGQEQFEGETAWETKVRQQRMILQTQFVDKLLGMLLDKLEANDAYKDALVVIQADHGVSLDPGFSHRFISRDYSNAPDIAYPPLFIHAPGQTKGVISDLNVENIDLMPMLAKILDTAVPWEMDGMLPDEKTGDRAANKTIVLNPHPYDIAVRPERQLTYNSDSFQQAMLARIPRGASAKHYLDMLYGGTPHHDLIGSAVSTVSLTQCDCKLTVDSDLRNKDNPLLYIRGNASGDLSVGEWVAFVVNGKISGLSEIFERGGQKMFATLVYNEDYGDNWSEPSVVRVNSDGTLGESVSLD